MQQLSRSQINHFIEKGFIKIEQAIPEVICAQVRDILWNETGVDPSDPSTWVKPIIRLWYYDQEPFRIAANTPMLLQAFDQLAGENNWYPKNNLGSFPIRFPSSEDPGDTGWHVDGSFPADNSDNFSTWKVNVFSKGRALLMLFLFSDVGEKDAPTRIRTESHMDVAKILEPYGEEGLSFIDLAKQLDTISDRPIELATGKAGTVYLCHPFLVHGAQPHHGTTPRFMAQPALELKNPFSLRGNADECAPVEKAIRLALAK